jgi:hypothetical protein
LHHHRHYLSHILSHPNHLYPPEIFKTLNTINLFAFYSALATASGCTHTPRRIGSPSCVGRSALVY